MEIFDKVYGPEKIADHVLIALAKSKPLQRLKKINQAGSQLVKLHKKTTRYEHCVGVALLLKRYGASLEEQIAGLLHDVPHTAFSHAMDFAFGDHERQTYHEHFKKGLILNSEIPKILQSYKIDTQHVVDEANFSLLEQPLPALCADRIDYFLREIVNDYGRSPKIDNFLSHIKVFDSRFVFDDREAAEKFSRLFMKQCLESWVDPLTLATFNLLASAVRRGLGIGYIKEADLFGTDKELHKKLLASTDKEIKKHMSLLKPGLSISLVKNGFNFHTWGKPRYVDPEVLVNNHLVRLSRLDNEFKKRIPKFIETVKKGHKIRILKA
ncbi:MAG TPA: HD domain-containing protein [Candidatus Nanoarchaeia archaeon]